MKKTKALLILFTLIGSASGAMADCKQNEAQVVGKVSTYVSIDSKTGACEVKAIFSQFNSSLMCPLDQSTVESSSVLLAKCPTRSETFSGVLVDKGSGSIYLE